MCLYYIYIYIYIYIYKTHLFKRDFILFAFCRNDFCCTNNVSKVPTPLYEYEECAPADADFICIVG